MTWGCAARRRLGRCCQVRAGEPELDAGSQRGVKVEVVVLGGAGGPVDPREHHSLGGRRRRGQEADFGVLLRNYSDHFGA